MAKHESEYTKRVVRKREEGDSLNQAGFSDVRRQTKERQGGG